MIMKLHSTNRYLLPVTLLCGCALLAGCANVGRGVQRVGTNIHEQTIEYDRRLSKMFESEAEQRERERQPKPDTAYCYRTLGQADCYGQPVLGAKTRLVGKQIPEPMFDELNYPYPEERPEAVYIDVADKETASPSMQGKAIVAPPQAVEVTPLAPPPVARSNEPQPLMPQIQ